MTVRANRRRQGRKPPRRHANPRTSGALAIAVAIVPLRGLAAAEPS